MRQNLVSLFLIVAVFSFARGAAAQAAPRTDKSIPPLPPAPYGIDGTLNRSPGLRLTLSPEWAYRTFLQQEPSSPDKRYVANGLFGASVRLELYPLAFVSPAINVAKDIGITANYGRALVGQKSHDIDTDTEISTRWYRFGFGARYRILGGTRPIALGFTLGVEQSVFDFDTTPPARPVAIGRYTLLPVGMDFRYAWGRFSIFADGRFLLPLTASPPGNRTPTGVRLGGEIAGGGIVRLGRYFEVEARVDYTLLYLNLAPAGGRTQNAKVLDQYLVFSVGPTLLLY